MIKRLFWDLEVSPNIVLAWRIGRKVNLSYENIIKERAIISCAWKWQGGTTESLTWDSGQNDRSLLKEFIPILNEADESVAHFGDCVSVDTPILTTDLKWINAGELSVGDKLVGFEENSQIKNQCRRVLESEVISHVIESRRCLKVRFNNGDEVTTTPEHPWLKLAANGRDYRWCETKNLKVGQRVEKFLTPWRTDSSYESGWLSGFISGEGNLKQEGAVISFCQRPGKTWDQALDYCDKLGIKISKSKQVKAYGLGRGDSLSVDTVGGKWEAMSVLGRLRIQRLIDNIKWDKMGQLKGKFTTTSTIVSIEDAGNCDVALMSTSSKTYFASGYPMHNSFDLKWLKARALFHDIPTLHKYVTVDTCKLANQFYLNSRKLDYIAQFLGIGEKLRTESGLWKRVVMDKCPESLEFMAEYNRADVDLLEKVWERLSEVTPHRVHAGVLAGHDKWSCPRCESEKVSISKTRVTATGYKLFQFQCRDCGGYYSVRPKAHEEYLNR